MSGMEIAAAAAWLAPPTERLQGAGMDGNCCAHPLALTPT